MRTSADFVAAASTFSECAHHCHDLKASQQRRPVRNGLAIRWSWLWSRWPKRQAQCGVLDRIDEIPFEPERKRLVTVHRGPNEVVLFVKGAPEELLPRARWIERDGRAEPLTADARAAFGRVATEMADRGLRVLAFAYRVLPADYVLADAEAGSRRDRARRLRGSTAS